MLDVVPCVLGADCCLRSDIGLQVNSALSTNWPLYYNSSGYDWIRVMSSYASGDELLSRDVTTVDFGDLTKMNHVRSPLPPPLPTPLPSSPLSGFLFPACSRCRS